MTHPATARPGSGAPRRGFALLIAISVLVILTIVVFALAASHDVALNRLALGHARHQAEELAQTALDDLAAAPATAQTLPESAAAALTATDLTTATAGTAPVRTPEGAFYAAVRPARADEPCYAPPLLAPREGDRVAAVCVSVPLRPGYLHLTQVYLVNTTDERARRVQLRESVLTGVERDLDSRDLAALRADL